MASKDDSKKEPATAKVEPLRKTVPCPQCEAPSSRKFYPFCSNRCSELDLGQWLFEGYSIPVEEEDQGMSEKGLRDL